MFDLGWSEFMLIAVVTVIVVGPKELPRVLRTVTQMIRKVRGLASEFHSTMEEMAREAEIDDLTKQIREANTQDIEQTIANTVDPTGEIGGSIKDMKDSVNRDARETGSDLKTTLKDSTTVSPQKVVNPLEVTRAAIERGKKSEKARKAKAKAAKAKSVKATTKKPAAGKSAPKKAAAKKVVSASGKSRGSNG